MSLVEAVFSILVIGIIVTIFSFVPSGILQNENEAKKIITLSNVIDDVAYEVELVDWSTITDVQVKIDEILGAIHLKTAEEIGDRFSLEGEVVTIDGKEFIKVVISANKTKQDFYYGFDKTE